MRSLSWKIPKIIRKRGIGIPTILLGTGMWTKTAILMQSDAVTARLMIALVLNTRPTRFCR